MYKFVVRRRAMLGDKDLSEFRTSDVVETAWMQRNKEEKKERREKERGKHHFYEQRDKSIILTASLNRFFCATPFLLSVN